MKLSHPISIDLLDFFKTGAFDCLKLGQSKDWILSNFPDPDSGFDQEMRSGGFDIWTYGNIEVHFESQNLFLIFSDNFEDLQGGEDLKLERWIFEDTSKLNLLFILKTLNENEINYKKQADKLGIILRLQSGIELTFENIDDEVDLSPNDFRLTSFGLVAENFRRWVV